MGNVQNTKQSMMVACRTLAAHATADLPLSIVHQHRHLPPQPRSKCSSRVIASPSLRCTGGNCERREGKRREGGRELSLFEEVNGIFSAKTDKGRRICEVRSESNPHCIGWRKQKEEGREGERVAVWKQPAGDASRPFLSKEDTSTCNRTFEIFDILFRWSITRRVGSPWRAHTGWWWP